jgi:c-di-GMP-related signal transduction protein
LHRRIIMNLFLERLPIFNKFNKLFGYELLFRDSERDIPQCENSDIGIEKVTGGKKAFINFTENILESDILAILPPELVIVEIAGDIEPSNDILEICKKLKSRGYIIALGNFLYSEKYRKLIEFVGIIKVDFKITKGDERRKVIDKVNSSSIKFLAGGIDNMEEFKQACSFGYSYFKGSYFITPSIITGEKLSENKIICMKLFQLISSDSYNIDSIEDLIKKDIALSLKLLKLINSATYCFVSEIKSMKQALALLGEKEIKNWFYVLILKTLGEDKSEIIIINSLIRAKFAEAIAAKYKIGIKPFNAYLLGFLSMVELLINRPLEEILKELLIPIEVKDTLNGINNSNNNSKLLNLLIEYEKGQWDKVSEIAQELNVDEKWLPNAYFEAILYSNI